MDLSIIAQASPYFQSIERKPACTLTPDLEFTIAAERWLDARSSIASPDRPRARYIRENTEKSYRQYIESLSLFFAGQKLGAISLRDLESYQHARVAGSAPFIRYRRPQDAKARIQEGVLIPAKGKTPCPVKPKKANQELGLLRRIMQRANCWTAEIEDSYQPLLEDEEEMPRALSPEQQAIWLGVSRNKYRWNVVHWYSILAFQTCMSTNEIRGLRLGDINLSQQVITVARKSSKNTHRARTIELFGADVMWALDCLMRVAQHLGACSPGHYLFPWRVRVGVYDPTKPMSESGIKVAWNEVRAASELTWFRQYDTRHTGITRLAEAGCPTDVILSMAGHVSEKMRMHYTHISQSAKRKSLENAHRFHHVPESRSHLGAYRPSSNPILGATEQGAG